MRKVTCAKISRNSPNAVARWKLPAIRLQLQVEIAEQFASKADSMKRITPLSSANLIESAGVLETEIATPALRGKQFSISYAVGNAVAE